MAAWIRFKSFRVRVKHAALTVLPFEDRRNFGRIPIASTVSRKDSARETRERGSKKVSEREREEGVLSRAETFRSIYHALSEFKRLHSGGRPYHVVFSFFYIELAQLGSEQAPHV